jgi:hypothetical protein
VAVPISLEKRHGSPHPVGLGKRVLFLGPLSVALVSDAHDSRATQLPWQRASFCRPQDPRILDKRLHSTNNE